VGRCRGGDRCLPAPGGCRRDGAGRRAAYRAVDLALPLLQPGKSIRFALLPSGQDPDDLIRSAGKDAMAAVIDTARPLVEMIWTRETESGVFDTPERRAALEARFGEIARAIGEESVRRHYIQAFAERIGAFFPDLSRRPREERGQNWRRERGGDSRRTPPARRPIAISDRLRRSTILTGRSSYSLREVVLVVTMVNHPGLIAAHLDAFAHIEFTHADLDRVRGAVLEIAADGEEWQAEALRARLGEGPNAAILARLDAQIDAIGHWPAKAAAAPRDAEEG